MKFTTERDAFAAAMAHVRGVVKGKITSPILGNVLVVADGDVVALTATDLDLEARSVFAAQVETPGQITVPAARLNDFLRSLPAGGQVAASLGETGTRLTLQCGHCRAQLPTLPAQDFPSFPTGDAAVSAEIPAKDLARLLGKTVFSAATDETKYYISGIYLEPADDGLRGVTTNGAALSVARATCPESWKEAAAIQVPAGTAGEILKLIGDAGGSAKIWATETLFGLEFGRSRLVSKVIDGKFPDYRRVIPEDVTSPIRIDAAAFEASMRRCAIMADDKLVSVRLKLEDGRLGLKARSLENGEIEDELEVEYDGALMELGFSGRQLGAILGAIEGEQVELHITGPKDPAKIYDSARPGDLHILMPLNS